MPKDCCIKMFNRIPIDEPVFTLRAQDELATTVLRAWIDLAEKRGVNSQKIVRAEQHLLDMLEWRATDPNRVKLPD